MPAVDERQLVLDAKQGDRGAFRILVERHMRHAYALAYRFVRDHSAAEDVAQEAFVRAYEGLPSFRGDAEFSTWLHRIVVNLSLNKTKQTRHRHEEPLDLMVHGMIPEEGAASMVLHSDLHGHVERALHELPTLQRAVVILRHLHGLSTKEVSVILDCSEGTVKTHLFRGLEKLRLKLQFLKEDGV